MGKRMVGFLLMVILLCGCGSPGSDAMEEALAFRAQIQASGCSFLGHITADYGTEVYTFTLDCSADESGTLTFRVTEPESLTGLSGKVENGNLTFDGVALGFDLLAEDRLSPAAAPATILQSWRTGYITACGREEDKLRLTVDTALEANPLTAETWLNIENKVPIYAEICYNGQRILSMEISEFRLHQTE